MSLTTKTPLVLIFLACACGGTEPPDSTAEQSLIGGTQAAEGAFDATLFFRVHGADRCTAARVGARHILTAAHCVMSQQNGAMTLNFDDKIEITNDKVLASATWHTMKVWRVYVHPTWSAACAGGCPLNSALLSPYPADVAVIETRTVIDASIPSAQVYWGPEPGYATVVGYGCENNTIAPGPPARLKLEVTPVSAIAPAALNDAYVVTPGQTNQSTEASLCPGDSGGPLYHQINAHWIIGVNAYYTFVDRSGVSFLNLHTRLGTQNDHDVTSWLQGVLPSTSLTGPG